MDVIEAIHGRRSIRSYAQGPVERALIEAVLWDAAQAPPPTRDQTPWIFHVIQGAERIAAYGERALSHARERHPDGPGWEWVERPDFQVFWGAPVVIVISGRAEDCCRAGQNLMLSAHARGLGTCWVGSPMLWLKNEATRAELLIPPELEPQSALCLGYPAISPSGTSRQPPPTVWL